MQEVDVGRFAGFIVNGIFKQYTVDKSGKENILDLYIKHGWVYDRESFMIGNSSPYFIEEFEDVEMLLVSREDFINILSRQPFINEMIKVLTEKQSFNLIKWVQASQTLTAEERYEDFQKKISGILTVFSSAYRCFLSNLGMTKETLSRIRASSTKK